MKNRMDGSYAYISGALTDLTPTERKRFLSLYEKLARLCGKHGIPGYLPHEHSDPIRDPDMTVKEVDALDRMQVREAKLLVAVAGPPSHGVGGEVEMADRYGVPTVLMIEADRRVSRLIRGNPSIVKTITFKDDEEALRELDAFLFFTNIISHE